VLKENTFDSAVEAQPDATNTFDSAVEAQPDATNQDWSSAIETLISLFIAYSTTLSNCSRLHSE